MGLRLRTYAGAGVAVVVLATGCAPVAPNTGAVTLQFDFADGRVETRALPASAVQLQGCGAVQHLQIEGAPEPDARLWSEIVIGPEDAAQPLRLAYAGALSNGAYLSWDALSATASDEGADIGDMGDMGSDPAGRDDAPARAVLQPVSVTVAVESPWPTVPELKQVGITIDGAFRAQWWLSHLRVATIYCDQIAGGGQ